ncbi:hypothetical protein BD626DRAFT_566014 [Schizophyllum amplum]|uniref:Plus3 domain-containing protein n=1 Tax=Schizophyllum amplum TaxID=97359 RepID=A0A550CQ84_9AGAR|nr:hypothetical protein BD626DRAFT_566014 [Auriculariopsis ampla]
MSDFEIDDEILALATESSKDKKRKRKQHQSDGSTKRRRHSDGTPESEDRSASPEARKKKHASSDEEEDGEKYPLEGKYIDEDDREHLLGLPELERENILAARLEEQQQKLDKAGLMAMFAQHQGGAVASAAKRQHTARGATKEKTRKLDELKAKRKEKDDRSKNKDSHDSRRSRSRSRSVSDAGSDMDMSESGDEGSDRQERRVESRRSEDRYREEDVQLTDMWKVWLTRDMIAKHCYAPWFEDYVKGAWVRYLIGSNGGMPVYRVCEVVGIVERHNKPYSVDGNKLIDLELELKHGRAVKAFPMDKVSNSRPSDREFARAKLEWKEGNYSWPTLDDISRKADAMKRLVSRPVTEEEITAMTRRGREIKQRVFGNKLTGIALVSERARLEQALSLAEARRDADEIEMLQEQLAALAPPTVSSAPSRPVSDTPAATPAKQNAEDLMALVNERNRRANAEAIRKAEQAEQEKRRAMKRAGNKLLGNTPMSSRPATPGTPGVLKAVDAVRATPEPVLPKAKPKGAASVLDSIEVDLGDF